MSASSDYKGELSKLNCLKPKKQRVKHKVQIGSARTLQPKAASAENCDVQLATL